MKPRVKITEGHWVVFLPEEIDSTLSWIAVLWCACRNIKEKRNVKYPPKVIEFAEKINANGGNVVVRKSA